MWGNSNSGNYNYPTAPANPTQNPGYQNQMSQSKIPLNPGVALLNMSGQQNHQQQVQNNYQGYNYNGPSLNNGYGNQFQQPQTQSQNQIYPQQQQNFMAPQQPQQQQQINAGYG